MGDSDSKNVLIRQISHIKSLFVIILHQNFRYSRHLRITNCISLESFIFIINLNIVSFSSVFKTLIYMFKLRCNVLLFKF